ncbi:ROK family protein [Actinopolymorpha sp. B17G11]|uniref:ROK family transcriptional regulator n=1 Tax=Actinopolymorpha sp. B17G11 TaxID=3160861 RepID=UPI0032E4BE66
MSEDRPTVLRLLRESHEERVLAALRTRGALGRAQLEDITGLSRTTLSAIVRHLIAIGAVVEVTEVTASQRRRGRPAGVLALNKSGGLAVGIDLGHRRTHVVIVNVAHEVVASRGAPCAEKTSWRRRVELALRLVDDLTSNSAISLAALGGVGVGVVGPVAGSAAGAARSRPGRTDLVHRMLAERFDVPIFVDNNTRLAALAEAIWGSATGIQNVLYVRLSYGVGGGLILGGHLFAGADGGAGEVGHVSVDPQGLACWCGGRGCLERYVSLGAVLEQCHSRDLDGVLGRLRAGDPDVNAVFATAGERIGRVLAASCNVLNPEAIVIGGELAAAGQPLLDPAWEAIQAYAHRQVRRRLSFRTASLGELGAARGGVALVLRQSELLAGYPSGGPAGRTKQRKRVTSKRCS